MCPSYRRNIPGPEYQYSSAPEFRHRITAIGTKIYVDGVHTHIEIANRDSIKIGCTSVEVEAIKNIYQALATFGYIEGF